MDLNVERTELGVIEICLSRNSDEFSRLAELVKDKLGGEWSQQLDHQDQSYWDLACCGTTITVHREHYLGVFVCCGDTLANRQLLERLLRDLDAIAEA
jgi:hypothetical protein